MPFLVVKCPIIDYWSENRKRAVAAVECQLQRGCCLAGGACEWESVEVPSDAAPAHRRRGACGHGRELAVQAARQEPQRQRCRCATSKHQCQLPNCAPSSTPFFRWDPIVLAFSTPQDLAYASDRYDTYRMYSSRGRTTWRSSAVSIRGYTASRDNET